MTGHWVVYSGSLGKHMFEGIELKAGRPVSRWDERRDLSRARTENGGRFKNFGSTITILPE